MKLMPVSSFLLASGTPKTCATVLGLAFAIAACTPTESGDASSADAVTLHCVALDAPAPNKLDEAIGSWLDSTATNLDGPDGLRRIDAIVGDAKLIGFGEPDHGFHEFPALRNAVFKRLVEKRDVRAITLETGIIEARLIDRYVTDVTSSSGITIERVLSEGFTHGMGEFEETRELVEWVKRHNVDAANTGKPIVRWGGKDLTVRGDTLTVPLKEAAPFFDRVGATEQLARLMTLAEKASAVTGLVEKTLEDNGFGPHIDPDFLDAVCSLSYDQLTDAEQAEVGSAIDALLARLDTHRAALVAKSSEDDFEWARQMIVVAKQIRDDLEERSKLAIVYGQTNSAGYTLTFLQKVYAAIGTPMPEMRHGKIVARDYTPEEMKNFQLGRKVREVHLADNVAALVKRHGKTFNFAANSHLGRTRGLEDSGFNFAEGEFLAEQFKTDYVIIGGTASQFVEASPQMQQMRAAQSARTNSLEARLEKATTMSQFVFAVRKDETCERPSWVSTWLGSTQLTWIGPMKFNIVPAASYDAIYWVKQATPARPITR